MSIQGDAFTELSCDGSAAFAATGTGSNGIFKGGSADVDATAQGSSGTLNAFAEVVTTVKLSGAGKG